MKKTILFSIFALGLAAVSCDDFDFPNPPAQSNEQLPVLQSSTVQIEAPSAGQTIDLGAVNNANGTVVLGKFVSAEDFPSPLYKLDYEAQISGDENFGNATKVTLATSGNDIVASPDVLDAAFHTVLGTIDPAAREVHTRLMVYATNTETGTRYRIGGPKVLFATEKLTLVPFNPGFYVEEKYYIIGTCTDGTIDASKAIEMTNSGISPYDDPNFSAIVNITADEAAAGYNWAVVPASTLAAGEGMVMVPDADAMGESAAGFFIEAEAPGVWNTIYEADKHLININVRPDEAGRFKFSWLLALDNLYVVGAPNWSPEKGYGLWTTDYKKFMGYAYFGGEYKLTKAQDWNHGDFGWNSSENIIQAGGGNIPGPADNGMYWYEANIVDGSVNYVTAITTYGIIGDATPAGWDASTALTPSDDFMTWTGTVELTTGEMKFRANDAWDFNLGGALVELTPGGDNIKIDEAGTYEIVLDLTSLPYHAVLTKK